LLPTNQLASPSPTKSIQERKLQEIALVWLKNQQSTNIKKLHQLGQNQQSTQFGFLSIKHQVCNVRFLKKPKLPFQQSSRCKAFQVFADMRSKVRRVGRGAIFGCQRVLDPEKNGLDGNLDVRELGG